jgi:GntR family transcriptional repressor for pyruvate dehydrogenase complex
MIVEQIKSYSAPERVVKQFLKNLETGEMKPGQKLPTQDQLADLFGVSRSSVREAMNALSMMGYLEITQGKGSFIKEGLPGNGGEGYLSDFFKKANLFHLMEIREVLECYAVEKASLVASEKNIELLKQALEALENSRNDLRKYLLADRDFHIAIGTAANLPEIGELVYAIHQIGNKKLPVIFTASRKEKIAKGIDTAKRIQHYIIKGEGKQAARCMRNHLNTTNEDLKDELLQRQFQNGQTGIEY